MCYTTPSAPSGQPLRRHSTWQVEAWNRLKCVVWAEIFYYWGDFYFCFYKHPTAPHCEKAFGPQHRALLVGGDCPLWQRMSSILPAQHLFSGSSSTFSTQSCSVVTIKNVSRHWWSLLVGGGAGSPWFGVTAKIRQTDALLFQNVTRSNYVEFLGWK